MTAVSIVESDYYRSFIHKKCDSIDSSNLNLPFFHSCRGEVFRKIVSSNKILATKCREFNEDLLYLFYGRPAYRDFYSKTSMDLGRFPVCFILSRAVALSVKRIFPFDSGAFLANFLNEYMGDMSSHEKAMCALADYNLGSNLDDLAKFIGFMYGDDDHYINTNPCIKQDELQGFCFELSRILDLAQTRSSKDWDIRALTSEVQLSNSIDIDGIYVKAIIMPTQIISGDSNLQRYLYENNIDVLDYNVIRMKVENASTIIDMMANDYRIGKEFL